MARVSTAGNAKPKLSRAERNDEVKRARRASVVGRQKTRNGQQCRRRKGLMRHTAMSCFPSHATALAQTQERKGPPSAAQDFCHRTSEPRAIFKFGIRNFVFARWLNGLRHAISLSNAFASFRSRVSNPSVNHLCAGANSSCASLTLPWSRAGATCIASPGRPLHLVGADQITLRRSRRRWRSRRLSRARCRSGRSSLKDPRVTRWISIPTR
jgi:hypothetical protein